MLRTLASRTRSARRRSGAVLIVVLAMLVLFAVLGLSFVLYSEAQLSAARAQKLSVNEETEPNAQLASEGWMGPFIYDVSDTGNDLTNPLRGHSVGRSKYGYRAGVQTLLPFAAVNAVPQDPAGFTFNGITDSREIVRFTWDQTSSSVFDPERYYDFTNGAPTFRNNPAVALVDRAGMTGNNGSYVPKNYPFTYADRHDFYLAQINPATGEVVVPSFHRPDLGSWNPNAGAMYFENQLAAGKFRTLRPRVADGHTNFPPVPVNADGTYTGDVANLKYIGAGNGQKNDSYWMDAGGPVLRWRGKFYKAMVAPLVLDLNGRVNLSTAGNLARLPTTPTLPHGSKGGLGPWEVNPMSVGLSDADLIALVQGRQGGVATPPADPYTAQTYTTRINGRRMPWQGGLLDFDARDATAGDGALLLPLTGTVQTTPIFNRVTATGPRYRYEPSQTAVDVATADHPAQFNPLLYARKAGTAGAGGFGHDDFMKMYPRYSDPKNRQANTSSVPAGTTLATNNGVRALTTTFSSTQRWAAVPVVGRLSTDLPAVPSTLARLGPVDLNRPLPDYRKNPALPPSPLNLWNPTVGAEQPSWYAAHSARQRLARDIFVRMAARYGLINGTTAVYYTDTASVEVFADPATDTTGNAVLLMRLAQAAVNMVDHVDGDDVSTPFVWRPTAGTAKLADPQNDTANFTDAAAASRVVYGTESPRLVLNEVYGGVFNARSEEMAAPPMNQSAAAAQRRYWVELFNPAPGVTTSSPGVAATFTDPVRSDGGGARLRYQPGVTSLQDPTSGAATLYPAVAADYNPYQIQVAVAPATVTAPPYATALRNAIATGGYGAAATDTAALLAALPAPNTTALLARVNTFTPAVANPLLAGDAANVVLPATGTAGANGGNVGYYLVGPQAAFPTSPAGGVTSSVSLTDHAGVPTPAAPAGSLAFDTAAAALADDAAVVTEMGKSSTVILRRLLNPYLPPNDPQNAAGVLDARFPYNAAVPPNPYLTVDFVEYVPTRDKVMYTGTGGHTPTAPNAPTVGRIHPFAAFPDYGTSNAATPVAAVQDQVNAAVTAGPPHTFFNLNNPADNTRGTPAPATYGFEWLAHPDRELVSTPEAAAVSFTSPALLTHAFFNSTAAAPYQYQGHVVGLNNPLAVTINSVADTVRMLTDAEGLLVCGSRLPGVPVGGRTPGLVNLNAVNDVRVLNAVFDPQAGDGFAATAPTYVSNLWTNYISPAAPPTPTAIARTPYGVPRATVYEVANPATTAADYPFVMGQTTWGPTNAAALPPRDHPFGRRVYDDTTTTPNPTIFPNFSAPPAPAVAANHPALVNEPLQKAWNNLTSVSDSFLVVMTVGFFEVDNAGPWGVTNQPQLGRELFDKVPGDLRAQFAGVVDRSCLTLDTSATARVPHQTKLTADAVAGSSVIEIEALPPGTALPPGITGTAPGADQCAILGEGTALVVSAGSSLRLGYGDAGTGTGDGVNVTVRTPPPPPPVITAGSKPGTALIALSAPLTRFHGAGTLVLGTTGAGGVTSAVTFGNPGPQTGVTLAQLKQRGLVPYFTRLEP